MHVEPNKDIQTDAQGIMRCPEHGFRYKDTQPGVLQCLDLDEESPLPAEASKSSKSYKELKGKG